MAENAFIEYLRLKGKLKMLNLSDEEIARDMIRASGDCICEECGKKYYDHPYIENNLDGEGHPYLHITCNGLIVKL
jgi:hypothetical protein